MLIVEELDEERQVDEAKVQGEISLEGELIGEDTTKKVGNITWGIRRRRIVMERELGGG